MPVGTSTVGTALPILARGCASRAVPPTTTRCSSTATTSTSSSGASRTTSAKSGILRADDEDRYGSTHQTRRRTPPLARRRTGIGKTLPHPGVVQPEGCRGVEPYEVESDQQAR